MLHRNMFIKYYSAEDAGGSPPAEDPSAGSESAATQPPSATDILSKPDVPPATAPQTFPDNWRDELAGEDAKFRKQLERYASPTALAKAYRELQSKVSSGELKNNKLPEKPTDEELASWRKENNVPEAAKDYINDLPSGVVIGEADKSRVDSFLEAMHGRNVPKDVVQAAIEWNQSTIEEELQSRYEHNANLQDKTEEDLRAEWGPEYKRNINMINGLIATLPEDAREALSGATAIDGTALFNNANVVRWMVDLARKVNPVGTVVPGASSPKAIDDELSQIQKVMREDRKAYNNDQKMQERYLQLLEAKERVSA